MNQLSRPHHQDHQCPLPPLLSQLSSESWNWEQVLQQTRGGCSHHRPGDGQPDIRQQIRMETGQPRDSISTIPVNRLPNIGQKSCCVWLLERERGSPRWWPVPALSPYKESPTHWWRADTSGAWDDRWVIWVMCMHVTTKRGHSRDVNQPNKCYNCSSVVV